MTIEIAENIGTTLKKYIEFYSDFLNFEQSKLEAVEQNRLELLDGLVKQEEVYVLKSKGMELKRLKYQNECGFSDLTLRELINIAPESARDGLQDSFVLLNQIVYELQRTSEHCNIAIKSRLQAIERAMNKIKAENVQKTYTDAAASSNSDKAYFSSKV